MLLPILQYIYPVEADSAKNGFLVHQPDTIFHTDTSQTDSIEQSPTRFFTSKREEPVFYNPELLPQPNSEWQIVALSFSFLIIAFVRVSAKNFFRNLYSGLISRPIFKQLLRDGVLIPQIGKIPLLLAFLIAITVFIFQFNSKFPFIVFNDSRGWLFNGFIILTVLGIYEISRFLIMHMLGFIFKTKWIVREFVTNNIFFNTISTLLVLPLLFISIYARTPMILYLSAGLLVILFIFRMFRAIIISSEQSSFSGYHFFLYLCALEIIPVLMVIKFLTGYISAF